VRKRWRMSYELKVRLLTTAFAALATAAVHAEDKAAPAVSPQELKAKTDYCKTCHGYLGQGFRGSFPMPRLADSNRNM